MAAWREREMVVHLCMRNILSSIIMDMVDDIYLYLESIANTSYPSLSLRQLDLSVEDQMEKKRQTSI